MQEFSQAVLVATLLGAIFLSWLGGPVSAQGLASPNVTNKRHIGPTGKPCLNVIGSGKPQLVNHDIFDHLITADNKCAQRIKINVCYYNSQNCILMDVPPYERKEAVLGVFPKLRDFRFDYKEQF